MSIVDVCQTQRLIVRRFTLTDGDFIVRLLNDSAFIRYIGDKGVRTPDDAINYLQTGPLASYRQHGFGLSLVQLKESATPIGMCGLLKRNELQFPDLGFAFLPAFCGQGYAHEAAAEVLRAGVADHKLERVQAVTLPDNLSSNRLLVKLGFDLIGSAHLYGSQNNLYEYTVINEIKPDASK
ncbi:GNAT family N-acetyltransferase [Shewanella sp. AS1]|uniref:GNAT family N-acetyltransferase n=1 Tax=Shewanella sp. AS1 TaxID=2907626 RepID=UPI001F4593E6|nr:GNAT family N-acetyltransferase [Shewanella sp. AS1]MCE9678881.1 GNAT family N-acetyltransferase [Shewanella sp. AS1]